jgi:DNA-binding transcriptional LysR family regulator
MLNCVISRTHITTMDLTLLRAFATVAREGNLTRAAVQLHLTQPAVSLQIKHLQEALGVVLFTRTSRGLALTRDGQTLLPHAERALAAAVDVERAAAALRHEVRGRLRIGTILDPGFLRLGGFLRALVETHPQIETALRHGMSGWVLEQVRGAALDVGYYIGRPGEDDPRDDALFHTVTLTHFEYRVLAPAGWKERVQRARLARAGRAAVDLDAAGVRPSSAADAAVRGRGRTTGEGRRGRSGAIDARSREIGDRFDARARFDRAGRSARARIDDRRTGDGADRAHVRDARRAARRTGHRRRAAVDRRAVGEMRPPRVMPPSQVFAIVRSHTASP